MNKQILAAAIPLLVLAAAPRAAMGGGKSDSGGFDAYRWYGRSDADLVVRPDVVTIAFSLQKTTVEVDGALGDLEKLVAEVEKRYQAVSEGKAEVTMRDLSITPASGKGAQDTRTINVSGSVMVPLAPELDFWKRTHLVAALLQVSKGLGAEQHDAKKAVLAEIQRPVALLRNPEAYRAELMKRWVDRTRSFAQAAQSQSATLEVLNCTPPAAVTQRQMSLEEVGLSLSMQCHLDSLKSPVR